MAEQSKPSVIVRSLANDSQAILDLAKMKYQQSERTADPSAKEALKSEATQLLDISENLARTANNFVR